MSKLTYPFADTQERSEILSKLDSKNFEELINQYYSGWLVASVLEYSSDYPHLQSNWKRICEMNKVNTKKIVFVSDIIFDDNHKIINEIAERMTKEGYCIRRASEFIICSKCEKAIPCKPIWFLLKEKGFKVPKEWKNTCEKC